MRSGALLACVVGVLLPAFAVLVVPYLGNGGLSTAGSVPPYATIALAAPILFGLLAIAGGLALATFSAGRAALFLAPLAGLLLGLPALLFLALFFVLVNTDLPLETSPREAGTPRSALHGGNLH